ncbi:MAG: efflux RND transporter permease subunit [Bacteroidetes bacterium]|jgi:copper/silver efflux system protein|nr:efflux RND transporter permease subunit [Bacteroidota bacterium]MBT6686859.1 efflux RND transporter permease subunit [Bacteroidota bacterium]MBT7142590.1 efflux RND transporter permease subunit [Bacteroidota bacterium]MBT7491853.1 efflux RND transporter permease subunit [Bacteroidota bacterium]
MLNKIIKFFLENKLVTILLLTVFLAWGIVNSPFGWDTGIIPSVPVPVDAIPDIGENQQIVYTEWTGRSPQDIEDQVSYPLTTALLGIPGVKTIRSNSIFGVSSIYIIFDEDIEFYWSRSRILEKLNSLPVGTLPEGVIPSLGPDATALGQVYWYTLEGRDKNGKPAGSWDPQELRSIQDFYVKYALTSAKGVSEVASIGGYIKEYQVDIDPNAMKAQGVTIGQIINAVKKSNLDVGARTIEFNKVEYLIRALGYIKSLEDLEESVVTVKKNVPIRIKDVARINFGPASRRGGLDKGGADAVGGVVVARYGANPLEVINNIKDKIKEIDNGLPSKTLADGTTSKVTIVPFYDRSGLIHETLGTLEEALSLEILISILVVLILVFNLRASFLISSLLPIGVLMTFIAMHQFGVDANIVALSGIAIAIGVMVDVGVVFTENIIRHTGLPKNKGAKGKDLMNIIYNATIEVAPAVLTAIATTVISFMPVFAMEAAEGKLFRPLAFTKTFVMLAALVIGLVIIPTLAHIIFSINVNGKKIRRYLNIVLAIAGITLIVLGGYFLGIMVILYAGNNFFGYLWSESKEKYLNYINIGLVLLLVIKYLSAEWMPLGAQFSEFSNILFVAFMIALILALLSSIIYLYPHILTWALANKWKFLSLPIFVVLFGITAWQGFDKMFGFMPKFISETQIWQSIDETLPGIGKEFMPSLDEGSFLLMPTTMPHSGVEENIDVIRLLDKKVNSIPEVDNVVGKWGRVNSALDPAPISMFENVINYKSEYILDESGHRMRLKTDDGAFVLKDGTKYNPKDGFKLIKKDDLIPDEEGEYFRQWRDEIKSPNDIWNKIVANSIIPGLTSAPKLQPIETRLVMLATGMRAPMGIKVFGPDLESIEKVGLQIETLLKNVKGVSKMSVFADRVVGKPYMEIHINRNAIARYGLTIKDFQEYISSAVGGMPLTSTVEGRERYPIRVRYAREFRDNPEDLKKLLISTPSGVQIPLGELATIEYTRGAQLIKSENTFLVGYVIFDKKDGFAEVDVVENAQEYLQKKIETGELLIPAGVNYKFTGNYENQIRATKRLMVVIPIALLAIFLILYFQFRSVMGATLIFSGIIVAFSGGFIMLWLYGQSWFMNFAFGDVHLQNLFQIDTINLSVAVWVGFIALFGIATDDGVLISIYIKQLFDEKAPKTVSEVKAKIIEAGKKRVRPAIMTTATTLLALLPVLTSTGKGSDIMVPMAVPIFGGMVIATLTIFVVPVLYSMWQEGLLKRSLIKEKEVENEK